MAKTISLAWEGGESHFTFQKLRRDKLYGKRKRIVLDGEGRPCRRARLTRDGALLLKKGMSAQAWFDERGRLVAKSELRAYDPEGQPLPKRPSTLGVPQDLRGPVAPSEVLDLAVETVYILDAESIAPNLKERLEAGEIFGFPFSYYSDYRQQQAYILSNGEGFFALVGQVLKPEWCEPEALPEESFQEETEDDELDFEMF